MQHFVELAGVLGVWEKNLTTNYESGVSGTLGA